MVLVGAGHAHLHIAAHAARFRRRRAELVLVDPDAFWYSGLATGMLGGQYEPELDRVDPRAVIETAGGRLVRGRAVALDRQRREVLMEDGSRLAYDAASFNVGSESVMEPWAAGIEGVWPAKPIRGLAQLRRGLEEAFAADASRDAQARRLLVIGGGPTGCEIAANLDALARKHGAEVRVRVATADDRLLARWGANVSRRLHRYLSGRGIEIALGAEVTAIEPGVAIARDGRRFGWDRLVLATGLRPPAWLERLGLELGPQGGLLVDRSLRSVNDPRVFGAGDCISLVGHDLPMLGVYAVREAPVLLENLLATIAGGPAKEYEPQKRCLTILNLGLGSGLALWGGFHWLGPAAMWLKDAIDRRFLSRYR